VRVNLQTVINYGWGHVGRRGTVYVTGLVMQFGGLEAFDMPATLLAEVIEIRSRKTDSPEAGDVLVQPSKSK